MVIVKDKKECSGGGCNMLLGLGFLIVVHEKEKCKYFPIFLWTVLLAIFILQHLRILWYHDCLPPWASCSSYCSRYHALETVLMENRFFSLANLIDLKTIQQSTGLRYWFTTIVAMVYYELFSEYLGEMDISCITNCGLGMFDVWLFLWMKEVRVNIKKDCLKSILIILIMKVQVVWSCQMFEYSLQCNNFSD